MLIKYLSLLLLLISFLQIPAKKPTVFKNKEEALAELERMYPQEEEAEVDYTQLDEHNCIREFVKYVFAHPQEKLYVVYGSRAQRDAAISLCAFLSRGRGFPATDAGARKAGIIRVIASNADMQAMSQCKSFIIGRPADNLFIKRMDKKGKISIGRNKAQFRLFKNPNCLAIACKTNKMFVELVRVFIRSHADFDENCYSYFYMNK